MASETTAFPSFTNVASLFFLALCSSSSAKLEALEFPLLFVLFFSPFGLGFSKTQFEGEVDPVQCRDRITIEAEGEKWSDSRDNSVRICYANLTRSYFVWFCGL